MSGKKSGPLSGVRVLEIGLFHAGPTCTAMLGELGAEIIKLEDTKKGDPVRGAVSIYGQDSSLAEGRSTAFETYNSNKKSVALDIANPAGLAVLRKLVATCDVFLHNMRADTAKKLKIDFESLLEFNPKLVYGTISGFGPNGPDTKRPGLDPVGLARSGLMAAVSGGSAKEPILPPMGMSDRMAGVTTGAAIMGALFARERTGQPQKVEGSLLGGAMWLAQMNLQFALFKGAELMPPGRTADPCFNTYLTSDKRWLFISALSEAGWVGLCNGIARPELATDPRFVNAAERNKNKSELIPLLDAVFATRTMLEWNADLAKQGDLVYEVVRRADEVGDDPQTLANGYVAELDHPDLGRVKHVAYPVHVNGKPSTGGLGPSPIHGEHSGEVLSDILGMSENEIAGLVSQGLLIDRPRQK